MTADGKGRWTWPIVVSSGLLLSLRFGFNYGIGNHNTYLLHALRRVDPGVLAHDWLASSTQDYHPVFTRLAAVLIAADPSGWLIALCNVLFITLGAIAVYLLVREWAGDRFALPAYLLVVAFLGVGSTYSVSGSYLFSMTFQPSTVAAVGSLFALLYYVRERFLVSGLFLAVAGAFHVNFAVLAFPLFTLAHVFSGRRGLLRRLFKQLGPPLIPLVLLAPILMGQAQSVHVEQARYIFQHVLAPQHYLPLTYLNEFVVYFAWCGLGAVAGWEVLGETPAARRLRALWISTLILVSAATLLTTVMFLPEVSQLYFWRLAPFTVILAQIFAAVGFVKHLSAEDTRLPTFHRTVILIVCAVFIWLTFRYHYGEFRFTQYGLLIALTVAFYVRPWFLRIPHLRAGLFAAFAISGAWIVAAMVPAVGLASRSNLISGMPSDEEELYRWAATTPEASQFLIPPQLQNFRFHARRAVLADFKSTPVDPEQLLEWYRRIGLICGEADVRGYRECVAAYATLDSARLAQIHEAYPFDYLIVLQNQSFTGTTGFESVFTNRTYHVFGATR